MLEAVLLTQEGGWWWGGGFVAFFFVLVAALLVLKILVFRGWGRRTWPDTSPEAILKRRLASGEISEADYDRVAALLKR